MLNFFYVARNTAKETLREPIFLLLLGTAAALIGMFPSISLYVFREQIKMVIDSSMATTLLFGLFAAVVCASHAITREIRNGTALLLLSKPVPRWNFILAKIAGILFVLTIFVYVCNLASLIALKVAVDQFRLDYVTLYSYYGMIALAFAYGGLRNYLSAKSFSEEAVMAMTVLFTVCTLVFYSINTKVDPENSLPLPFVLPALLLLFFAVWAMGAISVTLSTRLDIIPNLILCSIVFLIGLVSDYYFGRHAGDSYVCAILYASIPNWQLFWLADALASKRSIPPAYVAYGAAYSAFYISFCSFLAMLLFSGREVAEGTSTV